MFFYGFAQNQGSLKELVNTTKIENKIVYTPFGPTYESNVHHVKSGHYLDLDGDTVRLINSKTKKETKEYVLNKADIFPDKLRVTQKSIDFYNSSFNIDVKDGWQTWAQFSLNGIDPESILGVSANWYVPSHPINNINQLIYIFIGMGTTVNGVSHIVQPVLQWGVSPAGGGPFWAMCNWYVSSNYQIFYDTLIKVEPGDLIHGEVKLESSVEDFFNYASSFTINGFSNKLSINDLPKLLFVDFALEYYNSTACNAFLIDEKIRISNIQIKTENILSNHQYTWQVNNLNNNCNLSTEIIKQSLNNGVIHININSPLPSNNNDEIRVYPNPSKTKLHISPKTQLLNCNLDIFSGNGKLVQNYFFKDLNHEIDLEIEDLPPGLYLLTFRYDSYNVTLWKKYKYFKIIKQ